MIAPAVYTVQPGDTLSAIAERQLGSAALWPRVCAENAIRDCDLIYPGQQIRLGGPARHAAPVQDADDGAYQPRHAALYRPRHSSGQVSNTLPCSGAICPGPGIVPVHVTAGGLLGIAQYLRGHGFTRAAAAGITADIDGESAGNPESVGSGGFGLIGWTGNTLGLPAGYTGPTGNYGYDLAVQERGVVGYIAVNGGSGPVNAAPDPVTAGQVFSSRYERPAVLYSDTRPTLAQQLYSELP